MRVEHGLVANVLINKEEEVSIGPAEKAPIPGKRGEAT